MIIKIMKTKDFALSQTLVSLGKKYTTERDGKEVYFIFDDDEETNQLVKSFWNRELLVEPISYASAGRELKSRIFNS